MRLTGELGTSPKPSIGEPDTGPMVANISLIIIKRLLIFNYKHWALSNHLENFSDQCNQIQYFKVLSGNLSVNT